MARGDAPATEVGQADHGAVVGDRDLQAAPAVPQLEVDGQVDLRLVDQVRARDARSATPFRHELRDVVRADAQDVDGRWTHA